LPWRHREEGCSSYSGSFEIDCHYARQRLDRRTRMTVRLHSSLGNVPPIEWNWAFAYRDLLAA
jgi:hypothetical protein